MWMWNIWKISCTESSPSFFFLLTQGHTAATTVMWYLLPTPGSLVTCLVRDEQQRFDYNSVYCPPCYDIHSMLYRMWSLVLWLKLPHPPPPPNKPAQQQTEPPSKGERKKSASCEDELTSDEADASGVPGCGPQPLPEMPGNDTEKSRKKQCMQYLQMFCSHKSYQG